MPTPQLIPLQFPKKGFVENAAEAEQPPMTTPDCLNVRAFDTLERRNRGGQRTGQRKFIADAVNGTENIQLLRGITEALDLVQSAGFGDKIPDPAGSPSGNFIQVEWNPAGTYFCQLSQDNGIKAYAFDGNEFTGDHALTQVEVEAVLGAGGAALTYMLSWHPSGNYLFVCSSNSLGFWAFNASTGFSGGTKLAGSVTTQAIKASPDGDAVVYINAVSPFLHAVAWTGTAFGSPLPALSPAAPVAGDNKCLEINSTSDVVIVGDNAKIYAWPFNSSTGFGIVYSNPSSFPSGTVCASVSTTPSTGHILWCASGGSAFYYDFNISTGWGARTEITESTVGSLQFARFSRDGLYIILGSISTPFVELFSFTGSVGARATDPTPPGGSAYWGDFSPDGQIVGFGIGGTVVSNTQAWHFRSASVNPTARETRLVGVAGGSVYRSDTALTTMTIVASGVSVMRSSGVVDGQTAFQKFYMADGISANYKYLDFADNTVKDWASNLTAGSLPQGNDDATQGCRILTVYRGRVAMSGLKEEPQNWFLSKASDPFDWDYFPATPSAVQAVAGNNGGVGGIGELGDIVTALAPYQDDLMIMGGVNSIWVMRGDPAAGGSIDNISRSIGIVGSGAWTWDTGGTFYFFGVNGLYRMDASLSTPMLLSQGRLDKTLAEVDTSTNAVRLVYDPVWQGVHIFITPDTQPIVAPTHYFWDARNDAFWPDEYPIVHGPTAVHSFVADNPDDNAVLLGGFDSFIRAFDGDTKTDDGTAISSHVQFTSMQPGGAYASSYISDILLNFASGSDAVLADIFIGDTAEVAVDNARLLSGIPQRVRRSMTGGRNNPLMQRISGNAFVIRLSQSVIGNTWAFEQGGAKVSVVDRMRGRSI